ncbi:hypothetical protein CFC21_070783 [Triticum aestivum]|uniref:Uncharacterized protein n=2 Tax=Triticum aestivum TaxID=4565 RepID=A0A3B6DMT4_WHEAT|nr:uncharacterized protein LOC123050438 [Triticum aestivum]KAF7064485.1 hypothetical protein CFC21_070783 [Triticum aestivum]
MANFAVQLKDRFFGLVDRVAGCGRAGVREEGPQVGAGAGRAGARRDSTERPQCVRRIGGGSQLDSVDATRLLLSADVWSVIASFQIHVPSLVLKVETNAFLAGVLNA